MTTAIRWIISMHGHDGVPGCPDHCHVCAAIEELKALESRLGTAASLAVVMAKERKDLEGRLDAVRKFCSERQVRGVDGIIQIVCANIYALTEPVVETQRKNSNGD